MDRDIAIGTGLNLERTIALSIQPVNFLIFPMRIEDVVEAIAAQHASRPDRRATLVAISGIDGSGKGYIAAKLVAKLVQKHLRVANIMEILHSSKLLVMSNTRNLVTVYRANRQRLNG